MEHLKEANHAKGVYNSVKESSEQEKPPNIATVSIPLDLEPVTVYEDVVLYLATDDVPVDSDHQEVVVHDQDTHQVVVQHQGPLQQVIVHQQDEVQSAISSIVEIEKKST